jgi:hypothetical protein
MSIRHLVATLAVLGGVASGPYDIVLLNTPRVPTARGAARLHFASSPFGIAVTADGRSRYDVRISASGLPEPSTLGDYSAFVAWEVATDLSTWTRLGTVTNGESTVGEARSNKFMLVITAEASDTTSQHRGPTVLHGISPSGWIQAFGSHPLFRGISQ